MIKVNGKPREGAGMSVEEALLGEGFKAEYVAAGLNGEIVPRAEYQKVFLKEGDELEVFQFMGGGCF